MPTGTSEVDNVCRYCYELCSDEDDREAHEKDVHNVCAECDRTFPHARALQQHCAAVHPTYACRHCRASFEDEDDREAHEKDVHNVCAECDRTFPHARALQQHCAAVHRLHLTRDEITTFMDVAVRSFAPHRGGLVPTGGHADQAASFSAGATAVRTTPRAVAVRTTPGAVAAASHIVGSARSAAVERIPLSLVQVGEVCVLCLEPLATCNSDGVASDEPLIRTQCRHVYHELCMAAFVSSRAARDGVPCPLCRTELLLPAELSAECT
eukprot:TRINITY_DN1728_c0_g1_i1.p1 TRINITY_DN1728_c0_g1~~TRINITY_DN1728_c0_g1_i1.p1  ORF type:complete len:268 (+),score=47.03 TRINITY_DN1728_c0_g1_i1:232-1035(+)